MNSNASVSFLQGAGHYLRGMAVPAPKRRSSSTTFEVKTSANKAYGIRPAASPDFARLAGTGREPSGLLVYINPRRHPFSVFL